MHTLCGVLTDTHMQALETHAHSGYEGYNISCQPWVHYSRM